MPNINNWLLLTEIKLEETSFKPLTVGWTESLEKRRRHSGRRNKAQRDRNKKIRLIRDVNVTERRQKREKQQATFHKFLIVACVLTTISQSSTSSTRIATFCAVKDKTNKFDSIATYKCVRCRLSVHAPTRRTEKKCDTPAFSASRQILEATLTHFFFPKLTFADTHDTNCTTVQQARH